MKEHFIANEDDMLAFGAQAAKACKKPTVIYLIGDLGAGKTTFTRGFLRGLGYEGRVKSPTFTIVEPYQFNHHMLYHFDLYRLSDPDELEYIGLDDYFTKDAYVLLEWPENASNILPEPDFRCFIAHLKLGRMIRFEPQDLMA